MLLIKTYLDKSPIQGVGVFADEFIPKGTLIWKFDPLIDIILTPEQVKGLPEAAKEFILSHADPYPFGADNFCLTLDNTQYMNHSDTPTTGPGPDKSVDIALRDISKHTEITVDYLINDHRIDDLADFFRTY